MAKLQDYKDKQAYHTDILLEFASKRFQNDKDIVMKTIKCVTVEQFRFASDKLKSDKNFVLDILKEIKGTNKENSISVFLPHVSYVLLNDKDFALRMADLGYNQYWLLEDFIRQDKDVFLKYLEVSPCDMWTVTKIFKASSFVLRDDVSIVKTLRDKSIGAYVSCYNSGSIDKKAWTAVEKIIKKQPDKKDVLVKDFALFNSAMMPDVPWTKEEKVEVMPSMDYFTSKMDISSIDELLPQYEDNEVATESLARAKINLINLKSSNNKERKKSSRKFLP